MKNIGTNLHFNRGIWVRSDDSQIISKQSPFSKQYHIDIENFIKNNINENIVSNVKSKMTDWDLSNNIIFDPFKEWILNNINVEYSKFLHYHYSIRIKNLWGIVYEKGNYTDPHDHLPYFLSFCYYIKCTKYSSPLVFTTSRQKIYPKSGKLIIFPSHLIHHVPKEKTNERICLAGNLYVDFT